MPRTFLFSDLRGYTAYVEHGGDVAATRLLKTYRNLVRRAIAREEGAEVKTEGDSFYVVFPSSAGAVRCAVAIQRAAARRRGGALAIGIGVHAGEAMPFDRQYVGSAVNIAARLASAAAPGEILVSETVRSLIRTAVRVPFEDRGPLFLKGVTEPIHAFVIRAGDGSGEPAGGATAAEAAGARGSRPQAPGAQVLARSPMDAVLRGDLGGAAQLARAVPPQASADDRCDALAALTIIAAARGDLEGALSRTEKLLQVSRRAAEHAWVRTTYALRAWLYALARQPGEWRAELDRAWECPGSGAEACSAMLLAATIGKPAGQAGHLRELASICEDTSWSPVCTAVAQAVGGRVAAAAAARDAVAAAGAPFLAEVIGLQLAARAGAVRRGEDLPRTMARAGAGRLAELILGAVQ